MSKIKGIYAAGMSVLNTDLSLNIDKTILHSEKIIEQGCHGVAIFGSTGQAQLISIAEKIDLLNKLALSKYRKNFVIGTGLNSLVETINLMKISSSLNFKRFLIMPPAYYKYGDEEVFNFYSRIIKEVKDCKIILYNFEKLSGYKFSHECIYKLVENFPNQIVGVKDSSYNLFENLKIENFSVMPGSESKLLKGLELGCSGIITATTNVTASIARNVYDRFTKNLTQESNKKLCEIREVFEKYNLISGLHTFMSQKDDRFKNLLPPLKVLDSQDKIDLLTNLKNIKFEINQLKAA